MMQALSTDARASEATGAEVRQTAGDAPSSAVTYIEVPTPPSVNAMYRNAPGRGRVETQLYRDWKGHAGWRLRLQKPQAIQGEVVIMVNLERGQVASDVDNRIKALFDLLVTYGVITDDRFVVAFCAAWSPPANGLARITIMPAHSFSPEFQLAPDGRSGGWRISAPAMEEDDAFEPR